MRTAIALLLLALGAAPAANAAESRRSSDRVTEVERRLSELRRASQNAQAKAVILGGQVEDLAASAEARDQRLADISAKLGAFAERQAKLDTALSELGQDTKQRNQDTNESLASRSRWYAAGLGAVFLLSGLGYWYSRRRTDASEKSLSEKVNAATDSLRTAEENMVKSDTVWASSLTGILNELKTRQSGVAVAAQGERLEPDHHLPIKLADEIHRMRKRLSSLPEETKGLTPLRKSLERLESELAEQGYESVDHGGMAYTENLSVKARFVPMDELGPDQKVISKVITPQVNYNGVMIRMADIEVGIGS